MTIQVCKPELTESREKGRIGVTSPHGLQPSGGKSVLKGAKGKAATLISMYRHLQKMPPVLANTVWENHGSAQVKGTGNNKNADIIRNEGFTIKLTEFGDDNLSPCPQNSHNVSGHDLKTASKLRYRPLAS